jgi:hypothetical protein
VITLVLVLRHSIENLSYFSYYNEVITNVCHLIDLTTTVKAPEGEEPASDKHEFSSLVIILVSLVAVLSATLLIFGTCFLSWRKKQRRGDLLSYIHVYVSMVLQISILVIFSCLESVWYSLIVFDSTLKGKPR